jgi:hypothetical protein
VISSLMAESPTSRSFKNILRADIEILTTRVLRARKIRTIKPKTIDFCGPSASASHWTTKNG